MDRVKAMKSIWQSERAAIERWFPPSPFGTLFDPGTGDLLPAPADAIPRWKAEAFDRIDLYLGQSHVDTREHGWLYGALLVGLVLIAMVAHLRVAPFVVIGGGVGGAVLHAWPLWQLHRFRRDLRDLRKRIRAELALRTPIPRELAGRFRRSNVWRTALHVWIWGFVAILLAAQHFIGPEQMTRGVLLAALGAVGVAWILHFLSRRVDLAQR